MNAREQFKKAWREVRAAEGEVLIQLPRGAHVRRWGHYDFAFYCARNADLSPWWIALIIKFKCFTKSQRRQYLEQSRSHPKVNLP